MSHVTGAADSDVAVGESFPSGDGRSRRWESHRVTRRDELTRAARKAIHHGGPELSMDDIAGAIGTSKSIVYRYFNDRNGLQAAVGEAVLEDLGAALAEASAGARDPHEAIRAMVTVYLEMISTSPSVYAFVTRGGEVVDATAPMRTLADNTAALLAPVLGEVLTASGRSPQLAHTWAAGMIGFVRGAAEVWLSAARPTELHDGAAHRPHTDHDLPEDLPALADALTDWVCLGTQLPTLIPTRTDATTP